MFDAFSSEGDNSGILLTGLGIFSLVGIAVFLASTVQHSDEASPLEKEVATSRRQISNLTSKIESLQEDRLAVKANREMSDTAASEEAKVETLRGELVKTSELLSDGKAQNLATAEAIDDHMNRYRTLKRKQVIGKKIEKLTMTTGKTYTGVKVRKVSAIGIEVMHSGGIARVPFTQLPVDMREEFAYDPDLAKKLRERENALAAEHAEAVAEARRASEVAQVPEIFASTSPVAVPTEGGSLINTPLWHDYKKKREILIKTEIEWEIAVHRATVNPSGSASQFSFENWGQRAEALSGKLGRMRSALSALEAQLSGDKNASSAIARDREQERDARERRAASRLQ